MPVVFIVLYTLCVHLAVVFAMPGLQIAAIVCLGIAVLYKNLVAGSPLAWVAILGLMAVAFALDYAGGAVYVLYFVPVFIPLSLWFVFFRTLLPGKTPLATAIAESVRDNISDSVRNYTRGVTVMWSVLLLLLALWSALLLLVASPAVWSLTTGVLNYAFIVVVFMLEFAYRSWRFRHEDPVSFVPFMRSLLDANIRRL